MSRIIDINNKLNNRAYNFYCLDSHGELTFILEQYDRIIYANIYNVMVTHNNPIGKTEKNLVKQIEDLIYNEVNNNE